MRPRHVLVVEREHVASGREFLQVGHGSVVAEPGPRHDLGRAFRGVAGQDAEADTERGGGLAGHPGQLTATDHADDRAHYGGAGRRRGGWARRG